MVLPTFTRCPEQPAFADRELVALRPDFLVISPPKTGSTWLASNLRCHAEVFVAEAKEVKYFSHYCRWLDLHWYLDHFSPGAGRVKGEASPSYAILPVERVRWIRRLMPDVKLIFLMRDPVSRAWSHAKHNYHYREANFASYTAAFEAITERQWRENFAHEWPLANGDYLGQLRRWLSVFPREQLYLDFYESIAECPQTLLSNIFAFLGVAPIKDFSSFRLTERIFPGLPGEIPPAVKPFVQELLRDRTKELASFLHEHFNLSLPPQWQASIELVDGMPRRNAPFCGTDGMRSLPEAISLPSGQPGHLASKVSEAPEAACDGSNLDHPVVFSRDFDERELSRVLAEGEALRASSVLLCQGYRGYNLVFHHGRFYALAQDLGPVHVEELGEAELQRHEARGSCFSAASLADVKESVNEHVFAQVQIRLRMIEPLQTELQDARQHIGRLEESLAKAVNDLQQLEAALRTVEADVRQRTPLSFLAVRLLRKTWRWLRHSWRARFSRAMAPPAQPL